MIRDSAAEVPSVNFTSALFASLITFISPTNVEERSSLSVKAVAREFRELPEPAAFAVLNTISPPAPEPFP